MTRNALLLETFLLIGALFCFNVFSTIPFLQHEIIGHAFWWNYPGETFLKTLFDGVKMDGWPGRFRYVEYLAEAYYWKLMAKGYLPKDLYDFFGITSVLLIGTVLFRLGRIKKLTHFETFLCVSFFTLSSNSFLVSVFHFRKAKAIVAIFFAVALWVSEWESKTWKKKLLGTVGFLGFFTDPFFILAAPVLLLCADISREREKKCAPFLLSGMFIAFLTLLLLNGVVGPQIHSNSKLILFGFEGRHPGLLSLAHVTTFPRVLQELLIPGYILETDRFIEVVSPGTVTKTSWVGWLAVLIFCGVLWLQIKSRFPAWGHQFGFLLCLPICAFLLLPVSLRASFSGYYGYPFIVVLTVVLMNLLLYFRAHHSKQLYVVALISIVFLIAIHQSHAKAVYIRWVEHSLYPYGRERIDADYLELKKVARFLKENTGTPYTVRLDTFKVTSKLGSNLYFGPERNERRTDLAYFMFPLIFQKEIRDRRVFLTLETTSQK